MTITYQVEPYKQCRAEIDAFLPLHFDEVAMYKDVCKLDKDEHSYRHLAATGALHIVTCRKDGELIAYIAGIIRSHLHYRTTLWAFTDVYWLKPDCRKGRVGIELFKHYEATLKARGVVIVVIASKADADKSPIFERLGWDRREIVFSKAL